MHNVVNCLFLIIFIFVDLIAFAKMIDSLDK